MNVFDGLDDPELKKLIDAEELRQQETLSLIPSENHTSTAVLRSMNNLFGNKYSEGYPGRRYYEGQQIVDELEDLARGRARTAFGVGHANVQPYSGSTANLALYLAYLQPGDTVMGMSLPMGGHLTHGWNVSATGRWFNAVQYEVDRFTGRVDMDKVRDLALAERPKLIFCGGTAVPRTIDFAAFAEVSREIDAILVADIAHISGLVAGGAHPSPVGLADVISTTTHKTLRGPRGAMLMCDEAHAKTVDRAVFPGMQGGPHMQTIAGIAAAMGEVLLPSFSRYAHQIVKNAKVLADTLLDHGFDLVSGGTDNHLILVDLTNKGVPGKPLAKMLDACGITTNYNTVPFDPRKPFDPSGIRIGTPAVTTRGMGESEMREIGTLISEVCDDLVAGRDRSASVRARVRELCEKFPVPSV